MDRIRFRATGRVQGVGFRAFVQQEATRLGLGGWVRNTWDGSVEGEAEGPPEALSLLQAELRQGPGTAFVDRLVVERATPTGLPESFRIRRDG